MEDKQKTLVEMRKELKVLKEEQERLVIESLGRRLKHFREKANLGISEVSKMTGYSERTISSYERGFFAPQIGFVIICVSVFQIKQDELGYYFFGKHLPFEVASNELAAEIRKIAKLGIVS